MGSRGGRKALSRKESFVQEGTLCPGRKALFRKESFVQGRKALSRKESFVQEGIAEWIGVRGDHGVRGSFSNCELEIHS